MRRPATAALLSAALLVAGCDAVATVTASNRVTPFAKPVDVSGSTLTLTWAEWSCAELRRALVDESDDEVRIELMVRDTTTACDATAVERQATVELDAPLGDRDVIDAACLHPELDEHPWCEEPSDGPG